MKKVLAVSFGSLLLCSTALASDERYIKDINIKGLQRVEPETVLSYLDIKRASSVSKETLDEGLKRLYATGLFADVSFDVDYQGLLLVKVVENPIISQRAFEGNDKIEDSILESEVQMKPRSVYNRYKVQEDVQRILEVYKRAGRYAAVVEPKVVKRDQNRIDLVYEINEGPLAKVDKINFVGNKHFSNSDLQTEIMTKESRWYRIFSGSENYDPEKTNYDKELLRRFYLKRGFADFRVVSAVAELSPNKKSFVVTFVVDEGVRYKVNNITIQSQLKGVKVEPLYKEVLFDKGDWYNSELIEKTLFALTEEIGKQGFAFIDVYPEMKRNTKTGQIDITFNIREGQRIFIDRINITGNDRTEDRVIRREFRIAEGDAFNAEKIKASRRNVERLNFFSKLDIDTIPTDDPSKADINVRVEEQSTGYFNIGIGYSTVNGALVRAGVTENNFQGKGQQISLDASVSEKYREYMASFTEPYFFGRRLAAGADVFNTERDYQDEGSYNEQSYGGRLRLGWKYTDNLSHYTRYMLSQDRISNVSSYASKYIKAEEGTSVGSSVGQTLAYDKRDSIINPKSGYYLSAGHDVAGLGGDEKYLKFDVKAYDYYTFADHYTFKMFVNAGYGEGYGDETLRLSQRYYLGGNTMRGFESGGIGARDKLTRDALGGNWMVYSGLEMSFPLGLDEIGLRGHIFTDVGALGKPDGIDLNDVYYSSNPRASVGFGFQWLSPMGQIDIDFGFPIVKEDYDNTQVFRLNFGTRL